MPGSLYTHEFAQALGRPSLHLHGPTHAAALALRDFLVAQVTVLNIAGPRASTLRGRYAES